MSIPAPPMRTGDAMNAYATIVFILVFEPLTPRPPEGGIVRAIFGEKRFDRCLEKGKIGPGDIISVDVGRIVGWRERRAQQDWPESTRYPHQKTRHGGTTCPISR